MNRCSVLPLLLLWTLTASEPSNNFTVSTTEEGIKLTCDGGVFTLEDGRETESRGLPYKDEMSGEYTCRKEGKEAQIYVKFRTCDNCIELDLASIAGFAIGEVIAILAIGAGVRLVACHAAPAPAQKTSSDRKRNVPKERSGGATNDHYQPLRHKKGAQRDEYDFINKR